MDSRVKELVDATKVKFGLEHYYLKSYHLRRNVNTYNETMYSLCMEWFPNGEPAPEEDELNPAGTAVIDIHVPSGKLESIVFVKGKSYATNMNFSNLHLDTVIKWIEQETGLKYKKQFQLREKEDRAFNFEICIDGVPIATADPFLIQFNEAGELTMFSFYEPYFLGGSVKEKTFSLSLEGIEKITKNQLQLVEFPSDEHEKLLPIYWMEEIYIKQDQTSTIHPDIVEKNNFFVTVDKLMVWDEPINEPFIGQEIDLEENITAEQVFSQEQSSESLPITTKEQEKCVETVNHFLLQEYPNDTGEWILKTLHRDTNYIHAILRTKQQDARPIQRKLTVIIDSDSLEPVSYIDNELLLSMFDEYEAAEKVVITREAAYEKLKNFLNLTPYYVYDSKLKQYILCGKLDSQYGIDAINGEVILLDGIE